MTPNIRKNVWRMTKYTFYGLTIQCLLVGLLIAKDGKAQNAKLNEIIVSLNVESAFLKEVLFKLQEKTDFNFLYEESLIRDLLVSVNADNQSLEFVLKYIAQNSRVNFKRINENIYVKQKDQNQPALIDIVNTDTEDIDVTGRISDENGDGLPGVSIVLKNTSSGTISDVNGDYTINVPEDGTLVFSYIGYQTQEIAINGRAVIDLSMALDLAELQEVVVIGYGSTTKEKFNGAVSKVDNQKLNSYSTANFEQALVGNLAGVQIASNGKNPGDNSVIQIRGVNTLTAGTNPLIVVDGNPLSEGSSLSSVNTNDIESVSILKDAASAAIYGSRASNGVILITTKKGKTGGLKVGYDVYFGVQQRIDKFELADAYGTALFDYDARNFGYVSGGPGRSITDDNATRDANGGGKRSRIPTYLQDYVDGVPGLTNTDWADAVFRNAVQQSHHINLSGGTDKTDYSVSFGYFGQENIIVSSDYERYTNNIRFNSEINDRIRFGITSNISIANSNPTGNRGWSANEEAIGRQADPAFTITLMQPYYPIHNPDGTFAIAAQLDDNNQNWDGPISENTIAHAALSDFTGNNFRVFGNTYVEIEPIDNLTFRTSFGGDYNSDVEEFFGPSTYGNYRTPVANNPTRAAKRENRRENFITENLLSYNKAIDAHTFDVLLGYSYQQEFRSGSNITSRDFADDNLRNIGGATTVATSFDDSKWALESFFSRIQYDFANRYSISASLRRDGSSRFGANTKYGNFSSLSVGWTLSNESFFPQNNTLNFAKIRASWGQTGNNQIPNYGSIALIDVDNYVVDGGLSSGVFTSTSPNPDLSWETNSALNFGVDLGFLDDKLQLTTEYYVSNTTDLLLDVPVPQQSGFSESLQNIGELRNTGFELELSGRGFNLGQLQFGFNTNVTTNKNEVVALGAGQDQIIFGSGVDFITRVGHPISQFYNYQVIGVYKSQSELDSDPITPLAGTEVGDYIVRDANGDGQITADDRVMQGDYNPEFTYGLGFTLSYKGFDLGMQFFGVEGRKVSDNLVNRSESGEGFFVPTQHYVDNYFNDQNPDGFFRRPDFSSFSSAGRLTRKSNLAVLDGDYFRLRSLQLGYTIPTSVTENLGIDGARVYITGNNLFNITKYRGFNPDGLDTRSNETQTLSRGYIFSSSPLTRFIAMGVNVKF